jgi:hypothetical protein
LRKDSIDGRFDVFEDDVEVFQDVVIPDTNDGDAVLAAQRCRALSVGYLLVGKAVLTAIELDSKRGGRAVEIEDVLAERMLTAKLEPAETTATQRIPEDGFGIGLPPTEKSSM